VLCVFIAENRLNKYKATLLFFEKIESCPTKPELCELFAVKLGWGKTQGQPHQLLPHQELRASIELNKSPLNGDSEKMQRKSLKKYLENSETRTS
jgi:hypothetical protein